MLGLAAVLRAMVAASLPPATFANWGVIAAPRFLGRLTFAGALAKFQKRGPSSVSPLLIPNYSLHSMSGTISLALQSHGINFGTGGGIGHLGEALLAGLATLQERLWPGLWIVATTWDPEPVPDGTGGSSSTSVGYALALGLVPAAVETRLGTLRLNSTASLFEQANVGGLPGLVTRLEDGSREPADRLWLHPLPGLGTIELVLESACPGRLTAQAG